MRSLHAWTGALAAGLFFAFAAMPAGAVPITPTRDDEVIEVLPATSANRGEDFRSQIMRNVVQDVGDHHEIELARPITGDILYRHGVEVDVFGKAGVQPSGLGRDIDGGDCGIGARGTGGGAGILSRRQRRDGEQQQCLDSKGSHDEAEILW